MKGSADKHYKRWRDENHLFPDAIGHHIQGVTVHDGEWDSHEAIKIWNYTCGKNTFIWNPKNGANLMNETNMYAYMCRWETGSVQGKERDRR